MNLRFWRKQTNEQKLTQINERLKNVQTSSESYIRYLENATDTKRIDYDIITIRDAIDFIVAMKQNGIEINVIPNYVDYKPKAAYTKALRWKLIQKTRRINQRDAIEINELQQHVKRLIDTRDLLKKAIQEMK